MPSTKRDKILLSLIIIFLTATILLLGFYYFETKKIAGENFSHRPSLTSDWQEYKSKKYNFSFKFPKTMLLKEENGKYPSLILTDKEERRLIDITLTDLTVEDARQSYPDVSFKPYGQFPVSSWIGDFIAKDKSILRKLYIFEEKNKNNIWVLVNFSNFNKKPDQIEQITEKIIQSIRLL